MSVFFCAFLVFMSICFSASTHLPAFSAVTVFEFENSSMVSGDFELPEKLGHLTCWCVGWTGNRVEKTELGKLDRA